MFRIMAKSIFLVYSMFGLDSWMYTTRYCSSALCLKLSSSWTKNSFYIELLYKLTFGCWITIAFLFVTFTIFLPLNQIVEFDLGSLCS